MSREGTVQRVLDDVSCLCEVFRVTRVSCIDESLVANGSGEVEFESTVGSEEDVETATEGIGEVVGKVRSGTGSEGISVVGSDLLRFRRGRVGEVGFVLLRVLVQPEDEVEVLCRVLLEDEVSLTTFE